MKMILLFLAALAAGKRAISDQEVELKDLDVHQDVSASRSLLWKNHHTRHHTEPAQFPEQEACKEPYYAYFEEGSQHCSCYRERLARYKCLADETCDPADATAPETTDSDTYLTRIAHYEQKIEDYCEECPDTAVWLVQQCSEVSYWGDNMLLEGQTYANVSNVQECMTKCKTFTGYEANKFLFDVAAESCLCNTDSSPGICKPAAYGNEASYFLGHKDATLQEYFEHAGYMHPL